METETNRFNSIDLSMSSQFTGSSHFKFTLLFFNFVLFLFIVSTVSDSPYSERFERKDSIRRFFREQFQNDKKPKEVPVVAVSVTAVQSDTESVKSNTESTKSKSGYRLFRTVSIK